MIDKKNCFCALQEKEVTAIVEEIAKGKGKNSEVIRTYLNCDSATTCNKEIFCKFVNPLTTRIPLQVMKRDTTAANG